MPPQWRWAFPPNFIIHDGLIPTFDSYNADRGVGFPDGIGWRRVYLVNKSLVSLE